MRHRPGPKELLALFITPLAFAAAPNYEDEVCHPVTQHAGDTIPPCLEIETIETVCTPNGRSQLALKAHQECKLSPRA